MQQQKLVGRSITEWLFLGLTWFMIHREGSSWVVFNSISCIIRQSSRSSTSLSLFFTIPKAKRYGSCHRFYNNVNHYRHHVFKWRQPSPSYTAVKEACCSSSIDHSHDDDDDNDNTIMDNTSKRLRNIPSTSTADTDTANTTTLISDNRITSIDLMYMQQALSYAKLGLGNTFPNPAVGCVLVLHPPNHNNTIIGRGFHPKAGYPHAEIFALWEAYGYITHGIQAASTVVYYTSSSSSVLNQTTLNQNHTTINQMSLFHTIQELTQKYSNPMYGPTYFFSTNTSSSWIKQNLNVTAYVTLEPCSHYGKTPPCAISLIEAGVTRVVIGYRDPNPKVNGGGVALLAQKVLIGGNSNNTKKIQVDLLPSLSLQELNKKKNQVHDKSDDDITSVAEECYSIIKGFVKRIAPRQVIDYDDSRDMDGYIKSQYETFMNGKKRSYLRHLAGQLKNQGCMMEYEWPSSSSSVAATTTTNNKMSMIQKEDTDILQVIQSLQLNHNWMESIDNTLWETELVLLRLSHVISKRKYVKILGERIGKELNAHVVQVLGHTVLLYRPGRPPIIDFGENQDSHAENEENIEEEDL